MSYYIRDQMDPVVQTTVGLLIIQTQCCGEELIQSGLNTTTLLVPRKYVSILNFPVY